VIARSVALSTELALAATRGRVIDRGDYIVVETPDEPGWIDGNYLALPRAPSAGELPHWEQTFAEELSPDYAVSLRWDDDSPAGPELAAAGFEVETFDMMTASDVLAPPHILPMRALSPPVVATTADVAWAVADRHDEMYRKFLKNRARWQQGLVEDDRARFFGCFDGTQLVASCGVFVVGDIARYQDVQTLPTHRRRGIAGALLATAARDAAARGSKRFAILAQPGSDAQRVYQRVGFAVAERSPRASRYPTIARRTT
jgi:GNAT superfamily N-acetyltransferase